MSEISGMSKRSEILHRFPPPVRIGGLLRNMEAFLASALLGSPALAVDLPCLGNQGSGD